MTPEHQNSPAALGYRLPAEWEPHAATWLSWPHNRETWPAQLSEVEAAFVEMVRALAPRETVRINARDRPHARHVRTCLDRAGIEGDVQVHELPTNDAWIRDYGAIFVSRRKTSERAATCWRFDSWGGKYPPWDLDARAAERMAEVLGVPSFSGDLVLEGGAIETNGRGLLLTTTSCLPQRNPGCPRGEIEDRLRAFFGAEKVIWLEGSLAGDDTDGHVDTLARFVDPRTVVAAVESDPADTNYELLQRNLERLRALEMPGGGRLEVIPLPMPSPVVERGQRLPASYANFYVANGVVLLPAFGDPKDAEAASTLADCFPDLEVVPIDCQAVIWGLGALHCLTQQVPAERP